MSEELKSCPFCGGNPEIIGINNCNPFRVYCEACGLVYGEDKEFYAYQVVEAWNRRSAPHWLSDPPTEPGWYWLKVADYHQIVRVEHCKRAKRLAVFATMADYFIAPSPQDYAYELHSRFLTAVHWLKIETPEVPQ